ncbi:peroxiredoxin [Halocatena halophila]|uniref:peroxiredoxin n=1 Tax=Halocatena halophila TaxID=2814576 RepID=UPI002ED3B343
MVTRGEPAPAFELSNQDGDAVSLSSFGGAPLVLYFYPRASTPGCTVEANEFASAYEQLSDLGVSVVGVSTDSPDALASFADEQSIPFDLLSDPDGTTARRYDSLSDGDGAPTAERNTFLIGPDGSIERIFRSVSPEGHATEITDAIESLAKP